MYLSRCSPHLLAAVSVLLSTPSQALDRHRDVAPPEPVDMSLFRRWRERIAAIGTILRAVLASAAFKVATFIKAALSAPLMRMLAWASFLLAPGVAFADTVAAAPSGSTMPGWLSAILGSAAISTVALFVLHKMLPGLLGAGTAEIDKLAAAVVAKIDATSIGKADPQDALIVARAVRTFAGIAKRELLLVGATVGTAKSIDKATALEVEQDVIKDLKSQIDTKDLMEVLEGEGFEGTFEDWCRFEFSHVMAELALIAPDPFAKILGFFSTETAPPAPASTASGVATNAGPIAGSSATAPKPAGFAEMKMLIALATTLVGVWAMVCLFLVGGCSTTQKAALKSDATAVGNDVAADLKACEDPLLQSQAIAALPCISLGNSSADLACIAKSGEGDVTQVALCTVQKAIGQAEGSAVTVAELAKFESGARSIVAKLTTRKVVAK